MKFPNREVFDAAAVKARNMAAILSLGSFSLATEMSYNRTLVVDMLEYAVGACLMQAIHVSSQALNESQRDA